MKKFLPFLILLCAATLFAQNRVVGYFPHWAQYTQFSPADVRYNFLTEIRYCYLTPSGADLLFTDETDKSNFLALIKAAKAAKVKVVVAVGGLGSESAIQEAFASENSQRALANAAKAFASEYGIDGFELDAGDIGAADLPKLVALANAFVSAGVQTGIAVPGAESLASAFSGLDLESLDAVSLWFSDAVSASDGAVKPNSNTVENERVLESFASAGVPKNKLFPILPFYGKTFSKANGLGSSHEGVGSGNEGVLPYKDIMDKFKGKEYEVTFDETSKSEVAVSANETIVFNGIPSMKAMAEFVKDGGYGGIAAFDISGDRKEAIISILVTIGQVLRPDTDYKSKRKK